MNAEEADQLVATLQRKLGRAWADMVEVLRNNNALGDVAAAIRANAPVEEVLAGVEGAAKKFALDTNAAYIFAQQRTAKWLDGEVGRDTLIRYDVTNTRSVEYMRTASLQTISGVSDETREMIRGVMSSGLEQGTNPLQIARDIRDSIGLTPFQTRAVDSYRASLESGDFSDALGRELAHGGYDRSILAAQRDGRALPPAQVDRMVNSYRDNAVKARSETIARTEAMRATNAGSHELFNQAVEHGDVKPEQLVRTWVHKNRGKHNRDFHHVMNGQRRGLNEPFTSGLGNALMFPGDPKAGPRETVNCRCTVTTRLVRNAKVRAEMLGIPYVPEPPAATAGIQHTPEPHAPEHAAPVVPDSTVDAPVEYTEPKNPRRVEAARKAGEVSAERRREIHQSARSNLPPELHAAWDKEGHKYMREEAARIRGVKDRINAGSTISQAFAEKYGAGEMSVLGNEGDRAYLTAQIDAENAETWADEQERKYYEAQMKAEASGEVEEDVPF